MTLAKREREIRAEIDESFRPLFEQYESDPSNNDGVPLPQLSNRLQSSSRLPRMRVNQLLRRADADGNNRITYEEFVVEMTKADESTRRQLGVGKRMLNRAVLSAVPGRRRRVVVTPDSPDAFMAWSDEGDLESFTEAYDCRPPPIFIPVITLVEIGVFLYYALHPDYKDRYPVTANTGCPMDSPLIYNPLRRFEAWRFISYMLLHNGYIHLIFNCFFQLALGTLLELVHKFWRVGLVYIMGVIAGSLASSCFDPHTYLAGASGGCYALIGAHFANVLMNWEEMQHDWTSSPISFIGSGVVRLIFLLLLAGGDTSLAIYTRFTADQASQTSFAAHGGGFVAGLLVGVPLLRNLDVKDWEKVLFWIFLILFILLIIVGVVFNSVCHLDQLGLCSPGMPETKVTPGTG